jgi:hypothetical protein
VGGLAIAVMHRRGLVLPFLIPIVPGCWRLHGRLIPNFARAIGGQSQWHIVAARGVRCWPGKVGMGLPVRRNQRLCEDSRSATTAHSRQDAALRAVEAWVCADGSRRAAESRLVKRPRTVFKKPSPKTTRALLSEQVRQPLRPVDFTKGSCSAQWSLVVAWIAVRGLSYIAQRLQPGHSAFGLTVAERGGWYSSRREMLGFDAVSYLIRPGSMVWRRDSATPVTCLGLRHGSGLHRQLTPALGHRI